MKRNYVINYFLGLLALIFIFIGAGVFFMNVKAPAAASPLESIDITTVEPLEYYSGEFLIVDSYAYMGEALEEATNLFCYALVRDMYGNTQAVSISLTESDDNFETVKNYICNDEAEIGDCIIACYAQAKNISVYPDEVHNWYAESWEVYNPMLGISTGIQKNFEVYCDAAHDFVSLRKGEQRIPQIIALCCTVVGAVFAFAAFLVPGIKVQSPSLPVELPAQPDNGETESNE